jgi:hypothetical protein
VKILKLEYTVQQGAPIQLVTAFVYLLLSWSLARNGSTCHNKENLFLHEQNSLSECDGID